MATAQTATRTSTRANGKDHKSLAAGAVQQDLRDAKAAAGDFASAVKSSATHFGEHVQQRATNQAARAVQKLHGARKKAQDRVRDRQFSCFEFRSAYGLFWILFRN